MYSIDTLTGSATASNANWIVSLADVIERQKDDVSMTGSISAFYSNCISRVSDRIETICTNPIVEQSFRGLYDGSGTNELMMNNYPILSVSSLKYRNNPTENWTNIITSGSIATNCLIYPYKLNLYNHYFPYGNHNVEINYTAGYQNYDDVKEVALQMIAVMIRESKQGNSNSTLGIQSASEGQSTNKNITYLDLTERWDEMLTPFKRV